MYVLQGVQKDYAVKVARIEHLENAGEALHDRLADLRRSKEEM